MHNVTSVELARDCQAVQIPGGASVTLPAGTSVDITQTLGGSYTIHAPGGLFRVAAKRCRCASPPACRRRTRARRCVGAIG